MACLFTRRLLLVLAVAVIFSGLVCNGSDTLLPGQSLFPNQTLISKGGRFELGFFSPPNSISDNYYIGIWYKNIPLQTIVWVLNGYSPIPYSQYDYNDSRFHLSSNGSFELYNAGKTMMPWTWVSLNGISEAVILDTGNFVLRNGSGGIILWQSFDYPTDTWLPGMKLYFDNSLVSWRNPYDPDSGNYSFLFLRESGNYSLAVARRGELSVGFNYSNILWRSGALANYSDFINSYNISFLEEESSDSRISTGAYFIYKDDSLVESRIVIDYLGRLIRFRWSEASQAWIVLFSTPKLTIRPNTICSNNNSPACRCLDGFVPQIKQERDLSNFSSVCVRNVPLECAEGKTKRFIKIRVPTLPTNPQSLQVSNGVCKLVCSRNCSCAAYVDTNGGLCVWYLEYLPLMESLQSNSVGVDIYIKTEATHTAATTTTVVVVAIVVPIAVVVIISCFYFCYIGPKLKRKVSKETKQNLLLLDFCSNGPAAKRNGSLGNSDAEEKDSRYELPIFSFASIAASTNSFSITNRLGQGGFGPVYKGELLNGEFVAVKRLSRRSSQGVEEFKNEMKLIAKLQHRNLVRILGCCNENDEMILVYEHMPNKSLDFFLFEPTKKEFILDWKSRVNIISGIAQGLLYLHQYSRLRIVHRDLKASNILLDAEMNPKISDFGMARIFGGTDLQANTKRIVGTYGYMSPEYAMDGLFSVKSDVFAFGVLMLEIISGKKNTGFYASENLSLLGYAWNLWKNNCGDELIDPMIELIPNSSLSSSIALRYIQISLLCVEENPADRPLIYDVVGMLNNEKRSIASPRNPAFTVGRSLAKATPTQQKVEICSVNDMTVSHVEAR